MAIATFLRAVKERIDEVRLAGEIELARLSAENVFRQRNDGLESGEKGVMHCLVATEGSVEPDVGGMVLNHYLLVCDPVWYCLQIMRITAKDAFIEPITYDEFLQGAKPSLQNSF